MVQALAFETLDVVELSDVIGEKAEINEQRAQISEAVIVPPNAFRAYETKQICTTTQAQQHKL